MTTNPWPSVSAALEEARAQVSRADNAQCAQMLEHIVGQAAAALANASPLETNVLATAITAAWRSLWVHTDPSTPTEEFPASTNKP